MLLIYTVVDCAQHVGGDVAAFLLQASQGFMGSSWFLAEACVQSVSSTCEHSGLHSLFDLLQLEIFYQHPALQMRRICDRLDLCLRGPFSIAILGENNKIRYFIYKVRHLILDKTNRLQSKMER